MTRLELRDVLRAHLEPRGAVLAMWEAGSHAFARDDEFSDLDIGLLATNDGVDAAWKAIDDAFETIGGVKLRWCQTAHIFKGMEQRVYQPRAANRWLQVDIGLFPESVEYLYNEIERHGKATVLFDKTNRLAPPKFDHEKHLREMRDALQQELMKWRSHSDFFRKELARGRHVDAFGFYIGLCIRPLLAVLGMLHRPQRWDYGFRYVKEDMPADVVARLDRLLYVAEPELLEGRLVEATAMFEDAVAQLARRGVTPVDPKGLDFGLPQGPP